MTTPLNPAAVTVDGKTYDAVAQTGCNGCAFGPWGSSKCNPIHLQNLCGILRPDRTMVIWIERKEDHEAWRAEYAERPAKGEKFQCLQADGSWADSFSYPWVFNASKDRYRPKPIEPVDPEAMAKWLQRDGANCQRHIDAGTKKLRLQAEVAHLQAVNRIAIRHLDKVLNGARTIDEHGKLLAEARDWLESIGGAT